MEVPASMIPLLGRTQYRRGAVVFTLKHTFLSVGLESLRFVVTTSENGPVTRKASSCLTTHDHVVLSSSAKMHSLSSSEWHVCIPGISVGGVSRACVRWLKAEAGRGHRGQAKVVVTGHVRAVAGIISSTSGETLRPGVPV
ncbi:hypothetical protein EYF80_011044 [Liparis tanakae]|uniref:Uncharacterized protein n=1 Tax=Liparis tanakae TaxID=230148 RepID=A0A4Z2IKR8_9TELE|nr:hypothetical protein EYF80_011044 [Liparis tanakae]